MSDLIYIPPGRHRDYYSYAEFLEVVRKLGIRKCVEYFERYCEDS